MPESPRTKTLDTNKKLVPTKEPPSNPRIKVNLLVSKITVRLKDN